MDHNLDGIFSRLQVVNPGFRITGFLSTASFTGAFILILQRMLTNMAWMLERESKQGPGK
jgi:hypothetical protein